VDNKPSLLQGSIQKVYIERFKNDPTDLTVGVPILVTTAPNADFDGDALNFTIALDNTMADYWEPLHPRYNVLLFNNPLEVSRNVSIPKPPIAAMSAWLSD
jgi:hypothetical protein